MSKGARKRNNKKTFLDDTVWCMFINANTKELSERSISREKLIGKKIIFETESGERNVGIIEGFFEREDGTYPMMVYNHEGKMPGPDTKYMVIEGVIRGSK